MMRYVLNWQCPKCYMTQPRKEHELKGPTCCHGIHMYPTRRVLGGKNGTK